MRIKKSVLVVDLGRSYYPPFAKFGDMTTDHEIFDSPERIGLVLFTGGADIHPALYGEKKSRLTWCSPERDVDEVIAFRKALKLKLPMAGVCRGAQFLCAMSGGKLVQHIDGHEWGNHAAETWDGREIYLSTTHHQMMQPPASAKLLAWIEDGLSKVYIGGDDKPYEPRPKVEVEAAYFPNIRAVGMQYHPEMMSPHSAGFRLAAEMVETFLFNDTKEEK